MLVYSCILVPKYMYVCMFVCMRLGKYILYFRYIFVSGKRVSGVRFCYGFLFFVIEVPLWVVILAAVVFRCFAYWRLLPPLLLFSTNSSARVIDLASYVDWCCRRCWRRRWPRLRVNHYWAVKCRLGDDEDKPRCECYTKINEHAPTHKCTWLCFNINWMESN